VSCPVWHWCWISS